MHQVCTIPSTDIPNLGNRLIEFARLFQFSVVLDGNTSVASAGSNLYKKYDLIAGFAESLPANRIITTFADLGRITEKNTDWYLGFLTYDVKNSIEKLHSLNPDWLGWPPLVFFIPDILIIQQGGTINLYSDHPKWSKELIMQNLMNIEIKITGPPYLSLHPRMSRDIYLQQVQQIKNHIARGDIYEINLCQEFYNTLEMDPFQRFIYNNAYSPAPFSAFIRHENRFLLCFSPERFLMKDGSKLVSQPIKGTAPRGRTHDEDILYKFQLEKSIKERTENIMIVDLVRNDLSRIASVNSVHVEELCGIYTYPHVHQMISTISATVQGIDLQEIIRATFPMGSMTGAPKVSAMKIIEEIENVKRGLYSGLVGYITPGMDFDFNVVIRSLQYNAATQYISYMAGSAITALSDAEMEYEECLMKAYAINANTKKAFYAK